MKNEVSAGANLHVKIHFFPSQSKLLLLVKWKYDVDCCYKCGHFYIVKVHLVHGAKLDVTGKVSLCCIFSINPFFNSIPKLQDKCDSGRRVEPFKDSKIADQIRYQSRSYR